MFASPLLPRRDNVDDDLLESEEEEDDKPIARLIEC